MNSPSILNNAITMFFNGIVKNIYNPTAINLRPGEMPFKDIKSLSYNSSTESVFIEMEDKFFSFQLVGKDLIHLDEYDKPTRSETQRTE